jgi:hypothetical protein
MNLNDTDKITDTICAYYALSELLLIALSKMDELPNNDNFSRGLQVLTVPLSDSAREILE